MSFDMILRKIYFINKLKLAIFLMALVLSGCSFHGCESCYDNYIKSEFDNKIWESIPLTVRISDEEQLDAVSNINNLFKKQIFIPIYDEDHSSKDNSIIITINNNNYFSNKYGVDKLAITTLNGDNKYLKGASINISKSTYEKSYIVNIIIHELFHSLGYMPHEDGIMCAYDWNFEDNLEILFSKSIGLRSFLKERYGVDNN